MSKSNIERDVRIYRAYVAAKADPKKTAISVAKEFNITRNGLYEVVRRIENGNVAMIRRCTEESRLDCLWKYKYEARFEAIPKGRKGGSVAALRVLISDMYKDNFPVVRIASLISKDRSTVLHHLNV